MSGDGALRFDWHGETPNSFLKWLVPVVLSDAAVAGDFERFAEATDKFANVELTIAVNGIPVDAARFLQGVRMNMDLAVADQAARLLVESTSLRAFEDAVKAARETLLTQLAEAGLELNGDQDELNGDQDDEVRGGW